MKKASLKQKIQSIQSASSYQQKLISSLTSIIQLKRKSQLDYQLSLQIVSKQLQKYILNNTGFLTDIVKSYQSYVNIIYHNQKVLIDGYDNQILYFLKTAQDNKLEQTLLQKIDVVDQQLKQCKTTIQQYKRLIKQNYQQLQLIDSEFRFNEKTSKSPISQQQKLDYATKYNDLLCLKKQNQQQLQQIIDSMMSLSILHDQTLLQLQDYQTIYLQKKAIDVFQNFIRTFVIQVSFIRSLQFDVGNILLKVKENQDQNRKLVIQQMRSAMQKANQKGITNFIKQTYRKWVDKDYFNIDQHYISPRVREKWQRVCQYYNQAC